MTFLVSSDPLISGAFAVRAYPGFGILGADIPADGDNGGSPVLNDGGIVAYGEYYWYAETLPASGQLTLRPDLTFEYVADADGVYSWTYRVGDQDGESATAGTVTITVGAVDGAASASIPAIVWTAPGASAQGEVTGSANGLLPTISFTGISASATGTSPGAVSGASAGILPAISILGISATAIGSAAGDGQAQAQIVGFSMLAPAASAVGTPLVAYTSAPAGSGYSREMENTTRPKQQNTTRH